MRKFPCFLFVLKQSSICYNIICMTSPVNRLVFGNIATVELAGGRGKSPLPFFEKKKCPDFTKKCTGCVYLWANSHLQCCISEKKHQSFPLRGPSLYAVQELFIKVPLFEETFPVPKDLKWRGMEHYKKNF